jgi:hypothetical protein
VAAATPAKVSSTELGKRRGLEDGGTLAPPAALPPPSLPALTRPRAAVTSYVGRRGRGGAHGPPRGRPPPLAAAWGGRARSSRPLRRVPRPSRRRLCTGVYVRC